MQTGNSHVTYRLHPHSPPSTPTPPPPIHTHVPPSTECWDASESRARMPMSRLMASAVTRLSPVIMMTRMPAVEHSRMAEVT